MPHFVQQLPTLLFFFNILLKYKYIYIYIKELYTLLFTALICRENKADLDHKAKLITLDAYSYKCIYIYKYT